MARFLLSTVFWLSPSIGGTAAMTVVSTNQSVGVMNRGAEATTASASTATPSEVPTTVGYNNALQQEPKLTNGDFSSGYNTHTTLSNRPSPDPVVGDSYYFDLGGVYDVASIAIAPGNAKWGGTECPKVINIYTSSSLNGPWAMSQAITNGDSSPARKDFSLALMTTQFVRLHFVSSHGNSHVLVRQVAFFASQATPSPTPYPTFYPTAYPTAFPTSSPTAIPIGGSAAAVGDPHLQNVHGERFDLMKAGTHVLINIPRGLSAEDALLRVQADARRLGGHCADMYFQALNVTGYWAEAEQVGGYHFSVSQSSAEVPEWLALGPAQLKVVHGHTDSGSLYLNVFVKHLGRAGFAVGGLLGEDDHKDVTLPSERCATRMELYEPVYRNGPSGSNTSSVAFASYA
ncbi:unnamed protein product [Prorocentrum cordatum]|uniref:F5/8 type C domain-containing protein n=1 Tax=Prorocentrum cordatum TaxID=2364126 RepID=A0ABN9YDG0_9DINO|nr:unnamed protein product [Polarella glacialis]